MKTVCTEILNSTEGLLHVNRTVPIYTEGTCTHVFTVTQSFRKGATFRGIVSSGCLKKKAEM